MKAIPLFLGISSLVLAGCSKKEAPSGAGTPAAAPAAAAAAAPSASPRVVTVTGGDNMRFDVTRIDAKAGEDLTIVLKNGGTQAKQIMGHNLVLLKLGVDVQAFAGRAATAAATDYFPNDLADQVIAHTKLLGPKQSDEITFKVPSQPGEYPYICTFTGHAMLGMKGVLVVQ